MQQKSSLSSTWAESLNSRSMKAEYEESYFPRAKEELSSIKGVIISHQQESQEAGKHPKLLDPSFQN